MLEILLNFSLRSVWKSRELDEKFIATSHTKNLPNSSGNGSGLTWNLVPWSNRFFLGGSQLHRLTSRALWIRTNDSRNNTLPWTLPVDITNVKSSENDETAGQDFTRNSLYSWSNEKLSLNLATVHTLLELFLDVAVDTKTAGNVKLWWHQVKITRAKTVVVV